MKKYVLCFILFLLSYPLYSQNLFIYNVDVSEYPTVKANFFAFDAAWNQQILDQSDVVIKENGLTRTVYNFNCSTPKKPVAVSSVLMLDVSNSMNSKHLGIAKECASAWVTALKNDKSECAITTFDHFNYFNQDFTTDKNKLLKAIADLSGAGGTDYNKALIDPMCGGLRATKTGKYQKVLILLTDGVTSLVTEMSKIIDEAKVQKCKIFVLTLDMKCPQNLKDISTQTGGLWFENINEQTKKDELFRTILHLAQGGEPCLIPWKSIATCDTSDINVELSWGNAKTSTIIQVPKTGVHKLAVRPSNISFGYVQLGQSKDTTVNLAVKAIDYKIIAINLKYGPNVFQIKNVTFPLTIPKNTNYNIPVRFTPTDSNYCYGEFEIVTDYCSASFSCTGGDINKPLKQKPTLRLTRPNGGEVFLMNVDTLIEWDGVVPSDTVNLEYSLNNGLSWNKITDKATGLKYIWKEIPNVTSTRCIIRVSQGCVDSIPTLTWQKTLGGSAADVVSSFKQTKDGGYVVAGWTYSNDNDVTGNRGYSDYWIVKLNSMGTIEWQKTYGGKFDDQATSIMQTSDDGYIVAGTTDSDDGNVTGYQGAYDYWVIKLNSKGALMWQKTLGGSAQDNANSVQQTSDGGYIVAGYSQSWDGQVNKTTNGAVAWIAKLDGSGNFLWGKILGTESDRAVAILQTSDGGYAVGVNHMVVIGGMPPSFIPQYSIFKLDANGYTEWNKIYGGAKVDLMTSLAITPDGGYIATGSTNSVDGDVTGFQGGTDAWIVKMDKSGKLLWQKTLGGTGDDVANSVCNVTDGGYLVACKSKSHDGDIDHPLGNSDSWIVKLSATGEIKWQQSFGGSGHDSAMAVIQTKDRGFAFVSTTSSTNGDVTGQKGVSDYWVVKLGPEKYIIQSDQSDQNFDIIPSKVECNDIDMKMCLLGGAKDSTITNLIKNTGTQNLRIDSIYFKGADAAAFSQVSVFPTYTIAPDESHEVEFRFKPLKTGVQKADMVIITQADTVVRKIQGEGVKSEIEIMTTIVNFGKVLVGSQKDTTQVVTIRNVGQADLNITEIKHNGPNTTDFITVAGGGSVVLKPYEVIKVDLKFKPSDVGRTSGLLELYYDGVGSPIQIQLYGEGLIGIAQDIVSPPNDTINMPIECKFIWRKNIANSSYNLQVSDNENFTDFVIDTTVTDTFYNCSNLDYFKLYYWRVKAFTGSEQSNWSPFWRFTTLMDSVNLLTPADLSKNVDLVPNITWEKGIYNKDYHLQISKVNDFATKIKDTLISINNAADVKNLDNFTNYFWRVRNESGDTLGYWSKTRQFKTEMHDLMLIYPANNQTGLEQEINFKWSAVTGAEYYQLQISKNNQFTDLVYSKDSITASEHDVPDLEPNKLYYWRVRVWNQESIGSAYWSEVWTFTTGETGVEDDMELMRITPNPAGDFITITLERCATHPRCGTSGEIRIYNALGEEVTTPSLLHNATPPKEGNIRVDISDLPKGMYLVKIGNWTAKFVKK